MTRDEVIKCIDSIPSNTWGEYFSRSEFETIILSMYKEYRKYSNIDLGFIMSANAILSMLDKSGGPEAIRDKYLLNYDK